jgi:hypothetical protein
MTGVAAILAPVNCRRAVFGGMGLTASNIVTPTIACACYMPYPSGQGDLIWQGGEFGLVLSGASSAIVSVTHRVSDPNAFSSITARLYIGSIPVGAPAQFRRSMTYVTDSVTAHTGINADNLPLLSVRVTWHQVAPGLAYVQHSYATAPAPAQASAPPGTLMAGMV